MLISHKILFVLGVCSAFGSVLGGVKYVAHGWDLLGVCPEDVLVQAKAFERIGIDGVTLNVGGRLPDGREIASTQAMTGPAWTREAVAATVPVLRGITRHPALRESFALSLWQPAKRLAWTDDSAWTRFATNMSVLAWLVREGGLRGIFVDGEDYPLAHQFEWRPGDPPYNDCARLARRRGSEVFGAIFREYPNITFLSFWLLSNTREYLTALDPHDLAISRRDLWPAFVNGMLDVLPPSARFADGCEIGYEYEAARNEFFASAHRQRVNLAGLVEPENREKYRRQLLAGFGLYIDSYVNATNEPFHKDAFGGSRLAHFAANLRQASEAADAYIWLYGERHPWIEWRPEASRRFAGKPTWGDALPGFSDLLRGVKNPMAFLDDDVPAERRDGNLFAAGDCRCVKAISGFVPNVLPAGVQSWQNEKKRIGDMGVDGAAGEGDGMCLRADCVEEGCFLVEIPTVKFGEVYAVAASGKGTRVGAIVYWKRNGAWQWQHHGTTLAFADMKATGWRRGRSLVFVPDGVDSLVLQLQTHLEPGESVWYDNVFIRRVVPGAERNLGE